MPKTLNETNVTSYQVEGIGYDFIPQVCEQSGANEWVKCGDKDSYIWARRAIK